MASSRLIVVAALIAVLLSDPCQAATNPDVYFFSDSDELFRQVPAESTHAQETSMSPKALAAASAALLGVPTPPGTNAAVAKEISTLVAPNPFLHAPLVLVLAVRSAPPLPEGWFAAVEFERVHMVARRQLLNVEGPPVSALKRELSFVRQSSEGVLRTLPDADWQKAPPSTAQDEESWDGALLDGNMLGSKEGFSVSSLVSSFGTRGQSFIHEVLQVAKLVEAAATASEDDDASKPTLVAGSISVQGLKADDAADLVQALEAAVAVVMDSLLRSKRPQGPVVVALVVDEATPVGPHDLGLLLPAGTDDSSAVWGEQRRSLAAEEEEEAETTKELVDKSLYIAVWIILLVAVSIGMCLMSSMHVTKDTLLYSGAKID